MTVLGAAVAALGMGCASSGYARYDHDQDMNSGMGASAGAEMGVDHQMNSGAAMVNDEAQASAESSVSALGRTVDTRANWVNRFPFYDWNLRTIETYTFAVPAPNADRTVAEYDLPTFSTSLPPGSVFVEAAGGAGEARTRQVIKHTANPW